MQPFDEEDLENLERATRPGGYKPRRARSTWGELTRTLANEAQKKFLEQSIRDRKLLNAMLNNRNAVIRYDVFPR